MARLGRPLARRRRQRAGKFQCQGDRKLSGRLPRAAGEARPQPACIQQDIIDILGANSRVPQSNWGDLNGQLNALDLGERRVQALLEEYGDGTDRRRRSIS